MCCNRADRRVSHGIEEHVTEGKLIGWGGGGGGVGGEVNEYSLGLGFSGAGTLIGLAGSLVWKLADKIGRSTLVLVDYDSLQYSHRTVLYIKRTSDHGIKNSDRTLYRS